MNQFQTIIFSTCLIIGAPALADTTDSLKAAINSMAKDRVEARTAKGLDKQDRERLLKAHDELAEIKLNTCEIFRGVRIGRLQIKSTLEDAKYCGSALEEAILEVRKKPMVDSATTEEVIKVFQKARETLLKEDQIRSQAEKDWGYVPEGFVASKMKESDSTVHQNSKKK